ncbi:hypothetical protein [Clostridium sp.]
MDMFTNVIIELSKYLKKQSNKTVVFDYDETVNWEKDKKTNIIMENDTAIELGHPSKESIYFTASTENKEQIQDGKIKLIGDDIKDIKEHRCSFGEIVLISGHGFNEENTYDRYLEMDMIKHKLCLKGYMIRAVPQRMKEWSRISTEAVKNDFSFKILGSELINKYKQLEYVDGVEIIFITSVDAELSSLKPLGETVTKSIQAMNKMFENLEYDCKACGFQEICDEVGELREMHKKLLT